MGERFEVREMEEIETYWGPTHTRFYLWGSPAQQCILFDARTTTTNNREIVGEQICPCRSSGTSAKFWLRVTCMSSAHFFFSFHLATDGLAQCVIAIQCALMRWHRARVHKVRMAGAFHTSGNIGHDHNTHRLDIIILACAQQSGKKNVTPSCLFLFFFFASIFIHFHPLFIWDRLRSNWDELQIRQTVINPKYTGDESASVRWMESAPN